MIRILQLNAIRRMHLLQKLSIQEISRLTDVSRITVPNNWRRKHVRAKVLDGGAKKQDRRPSGREVGGLADDRSMDVAQRAASARRCRWPLPSYRTAGPLLCGHIPFRPMRCCSMPAGTRSSSLLERLRMGSTIILRRRQIVSPEEGAARSACASSRCQTTMFSSLRIATLRLVGSSQCVGIGSRPLARGQVNKNVRDTLHQMRQGISDFPDLAALNSWLEKPCLALWRLRGISCANMRK